MENYVNAEETVPKKLVEYIDYLIKQGGKEHTQEQINLLFEKVMELYRISTNRDIFMNQYKTKFSKRLLRSDKIKSIDLEKSMILLLKYDCGFHYGSRLEGLLNDILSSSKISDEFHKFIKQTNNVLINLNIRLISVANWFSSTISVCTLPLEIEHYCDIFNQFYCAQNNSTRRRLLWQTSTGTAEIRTNFTDKPHILNVSTYQMCILDLFNQDDNLSFTDIQTKTNLPTEDLKSNLAALTLGKFKVLKKASNFNGCINEDDTFSVNVNFSSKFKKIKIVNIASNQLPSVPVVVKEDRNFKLDAAIVRLMKSRKTMDRNRIIEETTALVSPVFSANPESIKARIDSLVEREFVSLNIKSNYVN